MNRQSHKHLLSFFIWVFVISIPFWLLGSFIELNLPINLPISALMAFNPMIVALILTYREEGGTGIKTLLSRVFDFKRIPNKTWYVPMFLLMPFLMLLTYLFINWFGNGIPNPQIPIEYAPLMFLVFFISAIGEEIGWMAYGFEPMQEQWRVLGAAILLGIFWAVLHIIPYMQANNSLSWIFWQCIATVGLRVLIVWLYLNTCKSLFAVIVFHAMINVSDFLFPNYGSYYDPFFASLAIGLAILVILLVWGKSLTGNR